MATQHMQITFLVLVIAFVAGTLTTDNLSEDTAAHQLQRRDTLNSDSDSSAHALHESDRWKRGTSSESEEADIHSVAKRATEFLSKARHRRAPLLTPSQYLELLDRDIDEDDVMVSDEGDDGYYDQDNFVDDREKRRSPWFVGKRGAPPFVGKRGAPPFVGRRGAPPFVGKRGAPPFVGRRGAPPFVGKREDTPFVFRRGAPPFVGKRGAPPFVGRRGAPPFVGKRGAPPFVGRRSLVDFSSFPDKESN